ncbi:hypothetical protein ACWDA3_26150 [Nonomuraea rubra]
MKLRFLGSDSDGGTCPTVFATDRGTFVIQGDRVTDPEALAELAARGLPAHETVIEVKPELLRFARIDTDA